jgi:hypothetical protein
VRREIDRLAFVTQAADAVSQKKYDVAATALQQFNSGGGYSSVNDAMQPIINDLQRQIIIAQLFAITKQQPQADEPLDTFLKRLADQLRAEGKYADLAAMMSAVTAATSRLASSRLPFTPPWTLADAQALRAYSAGTQFETAGDILSAINQYRIVITVGQGAPYAPTDEAAKALEKLKATNPEALKDLNTAVLSQLQAIQDQLRNLPMTMRMPGYPGYPR